MKNKIIIGIILLCSLSLAYICEDETDQSNIPCDVVSPIITCLNYTYNVTSTATGTLVQSGNLTAVGDGTYKFQFDQTYGTYNIFLCENSSISASITVGDFGDEDYSTWGLLLIIFFIWAVFISGLYLERRQYENAYVIKVVCALFMILLGVYLIRNGLMELDRTIVNIVAYLHFAVGAFFVLKEGWEQYKNL